MALLTICKQLTSVTFFSPSEISELVSSEVRSELKEKSETFRSLQKNTFKFK